MRGLLVSQIQRGPERAVETLQLLASGVLPLFCLAVGDVGQYASQAFCHQDVAADGAYSIHPYIDRILSSRWTWSTSALA